MHDVLTIAIPVLIGIAVNVMLYVVCRNMRKTKQKAVKVTWLAAVGVVIGAYLSVFITDDGWVAAGPMIMALGMFAVAVMVSIYEKVKKDVNKRNVLN